MVRTRVLVLGLFFATSQVATAQTLFPLPQCALSCALSAIAGTGCTLTDVACICSSALFITSLNGCIGTACSPADQASTIAFAQQYCATAGVMLGLCPA
ncbi:hypothetical protein L208DRAFT_1386521 [Tricholoma matsutake]|nr:hypothetical protein L208DRAFT_1386521 [Tricholoma matsutake 945]